MNERKRRILQAVIDDYIQTAMPVGSRTISRKYLKNISSATIRNEMSDLEELGYLVQPHVSAGRVPNAKAYRLYVDMLMDAGLMPSAEDEAVDEVVRMMQRVGGVRALVMFKERSDGTTKLSLRSVQPINVAVLAQRWGGGGHAQAAGATLHMSPEQAEREVLPQLRALVAEESFKF